MAVQPDSELNLINGLSDFWITFFQDTVLSQTYFDAGSAMIAQAYLELCQTVLGTSLDHAPLFDKSYYNLMTVREDRAFFEEGASLSDDRTVFTPDEPLVSGATLINKVLAPTAFLSQHAEYSLKDGRVRFFRDPFNADGAGSSEAGFAARSLQVIEPAQYASHFVGRNWSALGVRRGDIFELQIQNSPPIQAPVVLASGKSLSLDKAPEEFKYPIGGRSCAIRVFRTPFDAKKTGLVIPSPSAYSSVTVTLAGGTTNVLASVTSAWVGKYLYVSDSTFPANNGFYRVNSVDIGAGTATVSRASTFVGGGSVEAYLTTIPNSIEDSTAGIRLDHTNLTSGTVQVSSRRAHSRTVGGVVYPINGEVIEGVDYLIDAREGILRFLSVWDPLTTARIAYEWRLAVANETYTYLGDWSNAAVYDNGQVVTFEGNVWVRVASPTPAGLFNPSHWVLFELFTIDVSTTVREIAFWIPDAQVDTDRLYTNFGYLIGPKKESSELYRAFLRGVSQLFLLGPSLTRFESALNVVANLPVIRDDGEITVSYDDGYESLGDSALIASTGDAEIGNGGSVTDFAYGEDGSLFTDGRFVSARAGLHTTDVGASLTVRTETEVQTYVITAVAQNGTVAALTPTPTANLTNVKWTYRHNLGNQQFQIESDDVTFLFTESDVDATITILSEQGEAWSNAITYAVGSIVRYDGQTYAALVENHDGAFTPAHWQLLGALPVRDVRTFRIASVDGPRQVRLDTPFGLTDAKSLHWKLSRRHYQSVKTDKREYRLPMNVPIREEFSTPGIVLRAFDPISNAIRVVDYLVDPTWWHRTTIPRELLELEIESAVRRTVSPEFIPNVIGPLDEALLGDPGLRISADDEGDPGIIREGTAIWEGGPWVRLVMDEGVRTSDYHHHVTFDDPYFFGSYAIDGFGPDGQTVKLRDFPPPNARRLDAPQDIRFAKLANIVYRRSVPFVMMDRLLKYHSLRVEVEVTDSLSLGFLSEATTLLSAAKPAYVYVFTDATASFKDILHVGEQMIPDIGHSFTDPVAFPDNHLMIDGSVVLGEFYYYQTGTVSGFSAGTGVVFTPPLALPFSPDRVQYVFGGFTQGTNHGKPLSRDRDYTINFSTGQVIVPAIDMGVYLYQYVVCALTRHSPVPSPWWSTVYPGETPIVIDGATPITRYSPNVNPLSAGLVERAVQITIG